MKSIPALLVLAFALSAMGQGSNPVQPFPQAKYSLTATNGSDTGTVSVTNILPSLTYTIIYDGATNSQVVAATNVALSLVNTGLTVQTKNVSVRVADSSGQASTTIKPVTVIPVTVANFTGTPTTGEPPLSVLFTNLSTGTITNSLWTFANATSTNSFRTNAMSFAYSFANVSTNTVSLSVAGYSTSLLSKTNYVIAVSNAPSYALYFDGSTYAATAQSNVWWGTPFSMDVWVKPETQGGSVGAFNLWTGSGTPGGIIGYINATDFVPSWYSDGNSPNGSVTVGYTGGNWVLLTVDFDGTQWSFFTNGVPAGADAVSMTTQPTITTAFSLATKEGLTPGFVGIAGAARIRLATNNAAGFTPTYGWTTNAVTKGLWNFSAGTGTNVVDESGNGLDLIIYGAAWTNITVTGGIPQ